MDMICPGPGLRQKISFFVRACQVRGIHVSHVMLTRTDMDGLLAELIASGDMHRDAGTGESRPFTPETILEPHDGRLFYLDGLGIYLGPRTMLMVPMTGDKGPEWPKELNIYTQG